MKALVALSGGLDSATVLARVLASGASVKTVGFAYGSKHNKWEIAAAKNIAWHYSVPFDLIDLTSAMSSFSSSLLQVGLDVPEGHCESESMKSTIVPARNIIFCSILAGLAVSNSMGSIWLGIHAGDSHIYPDCRPSFISAMRQVIKKGTESSVRLLAPFITKTKAQIVQEGLSMGVPYELTRTCYKDQEVACGRCGSCQERLSAFLVCGVDDPISYHARVLMNMEVVDNG